MNSLSVAEHAMMLILACAKPGIRAGRAVRIGPLGGAIGGRPTTLRICARSSSATAAAEAIWRGWQEGSVEPAATLAASSVQNAIGVFAGRLDPDLIVNKDF